MQSLSPVGVASATSVDRDVVGAPAGGADPFGALREVRCFARLAATLAGRSVLVTGGTGFVGKWLLEAMIALRGVGAPARITVLARRPARFSADHPRLAAGVHFIAADVRDLVPGDRAFDFIVHAANDTGPSVNADPASAVAVIVAGTQRVLDLARRHRPQALLLLSTGAVYGARPAGGGAIREEDDAIAPRPLAAASAYGGAKRLAETLAAVVLEREGVPVKIARLFSFAGEHLPLDDQRAFGNFVRAAVAGRPIALQGDGTAVRSYLHGADMALWLLTILTEGVPGRPYNVGSGEPIALRDLACRVARELSPGSTVPVTVGSAVDAAAGSAYFPDVTRVRDELGLDVWTDLRTCIRRTGTYAARSTARESWPA